MIKYLRFLEKEEIYMNASDLELEKQEQISRGKRIKYIRENELHMNKTQLAKEIGISSQFLGLVEEGRGNLVYRSIRKLRDLSGHSADYILYGLDDTILNKTKELLSKYTDKEIKTAMNIIKDIAIFIKN